jgi:D-lactate dehydrogenase (cytochrome)
MVKVLTNGFDDYLRDESNLAGGRAVEVALPVNLDEVVEFMRHCAKNKRKLTVSGARTGIVGGAVPFGGVVLSTERMNAIKEFVYEPAGDEWRVTLEPGVLLASFQHCIETKTGPDSRPIRGLADFQTDPRRFFFPVDATENSASLGGMAATNASGARTFGYGATRTYVRSIQVVLADGEVANVRRGESRTGPDGTIHFQTATGKKISIPAPHYRIPQVKHTAGFYNGPSLDLIDLFIGSEGLLGAIVEIELALMVEPEMWFGGLAFFQDEAEAIRFVQWIRDERPENGRACRPGALEYFDGKALQLFSQSEKRKELQLPEISETAQAGIFFEQGCRETELDTVYDSWDYALSHSGSSIRDVWSALAPKDHQKLKRMRHLVPEAVNQIVAENRRNCPVIHKVGTDLAVPGPYLADLVKKYRSRLAEERIPAVIFGHIGNNNLHVNMLPADETSLKKAKNLHLEWARWAVERGGTVIAEHGIGKIKGELLRILYSETELAQMRAVKQALDPEDLLGPGNGIQEEIR